MSQLSQEAGVRVLIGVQKEMPFPYEQGMSVSPGFSTAIQLRKVECSFFSCSYKFSFTLEDIFHFTVKPDSDLRLIFPQNVEQIMKINY